MTDLRNSYTEDNRLAKLGERLASSRAYAAMGRCTADPRHVCERGRALTVETTDDGELLFEVRVTDAETSKLVLTDLAGNNELDHDLVRIPLTDAHDRLLDMPAPALRRLVRRVHRQAKKTGAVIVRKDDDGQLIELVAVSAQDLLTCTGQVGLKHALNLLDERVRVASKGEIHLPVLKRPMVVRPVVHDHTREDFLWCSRPTSVERKTYDLRVPTPEGFQDVEVKTDRSLFASGRVFVETRFRGNASGIGGTDATWTAYVFGGVSLLMRSDWVRQRAQAIATLDPSRRRQRSGDGDKVQGIVLAPAELIGGPLPLTVSVSGADTRQAAKVLRELARQRPGDHKLVLSASGADAQEIETTQLTSGVVKGLRQYIPSCVLSWPCEDEFDRRKTADGRWTRVTGKETAHQGAAGSKHEVEVPF